MAECKLGGAICNHCGANCNGTTGVSCGFPRAIPARPTRHEETTPCTIPA